VLLYYITDRKEFPGDEPAKRHRLLEKIAEASRCGVDFIQLREKDLGARELERLATDAIRVCRESGPAKLLINSRTDVALACDADGVHLTSNDISPADARSLVDVSMRMRRETRSWTIGVSCHTPDEVRLAESQGADLAVFGPVFAKSGSENPPGLETLRRACLRLQPVAKTEAGKSAGMPVLALGGITLENAAQCIEAGAAGTAGIRLFQENSIKDVVQRLRRLAPNFSR
jgi:thiamine-phosphate pyrophosphorylase